MPKIPSLKPKQVIKKFEKLGFVKDRTKWKSCNLISSAIKETSSDTYAREGFTEKDSTCNTETDRR